MRAMNEMTDNELIKNIQEDVDVESSLETLEARHTGMYIGQMTKFKNDFSRRFLSDFTDNKTYFFWKCAKGFNLSLGTAKFSTYLATAARREVKSMYYKSLKTESWPLDDDGNEIDIADTKIKDTTPLLEELMEVLGDREKDMAQRYFYLGQTYQEIGDFYGISRQRVEAIINKNVVPVARKIMMEINLQGV